MIDIFSVLGHRLAAFGKTPDTVEVVRRAAVENPWFLPQEIIRAVKAIRCEMLERQRLEAWAGAYPPVRTPKRVLVVMAGNIPLVGFFDLLCVLASGHACRVKPSSKDTVLIGYVVDLLRTIDPAIPLRMAEQGERLDAVIATGSDNANRYFRMLFGGIPSLLRGSRQSVAVLSGRETAAELSGLEEDIFAYSGLGCRNVSLLFLPRGYMPELRCTALNENIAAIIFGNAPFCGCAECRSSTWTGRYCAKIGRFRRRSAASTIRFTTRLPMWKRGWRPMTIGCNASFRSVCGTPAASLSGGRSIPV